MKKFSMLLVLMLISSVFIVSVSAVKEDPFCTDFDGGADPWTASYATSDKGTLVDDCDGSSTNLKEATCKGSDTHPDNIKCTDFGAVCITVGVKNDDQPDYCGCPEGSTFNGIGCVPLQQEPRCGDGAINQESEQCDDGPQGSETCTPNCTFVEEECDGNCPNDIPEFTTIGAGLVLAGAGAYIYRKRSNK